MVVSCSENALKPLCANCCNFLFEATLIAGVTKYLFWVNRPMYLASLCNSPCSIFKIGYKAIYEEISSFWPSCPVSIMAGWCKYWLLIGLIAASPFSVYSSSFSLTSTNFWLIYDLPSTVRSWTPAPIEARLTIPGKSCFKLSMSTLAPSVEGISC